jgi:beta-mannanase
MSKEQQRADYKKIVSKLTDKQIQKEVLSYRRYFETHSQMFTWGNFNPSDFTQADKLSVLRELYKTK